MLAKLSLMGLYHFDHSLFDLMEIPPQLDKDTLITLILSEGAQFAVQYPDAPLCKQMLGSFSKRNIDRWNKLYETTVLEYNPIENYDRIEESTDSRKTTAQHSTADKHHEEGTDGNTVSVTGYNSETMTPTNSYDGTSGTDGNSEQTHLENNTDDLTHTARIHGNIGVTTSQQMIESQRELLRFDIYKAICDEVLIEFCVCVY